MFITPLSHYGLMYLYLKVGVCKLLINNHDISLQCLLIAIGYGQLLCLAMKPWNLHVHEILELQFIVFSFS